MPVTMIDMFRQMIFVSFALVVLMPIRMFGQTKTVAFTVDDLPYAGGSWQAGRNRPDQHATQEVNSAITSSLARHQVPVTGFVIERIVEELQPVSGKILQAWVKQGFDLGNHTYSHAGLNELTSEDFETDVIRGESTFLPVMKKAGREHDLFLRFPYNATGDTPVKHEAVARFLAARGYRQAPCTIDNEDYVFNDAYVSMLRQHDEENAAKLRQAYIAYTSEEIDFYAQLNKAVLGYDPPQIMLIHDNKLNADTIEQVIQLFIDKKYKFVSLKEATSDPIYSLPDTYVTKYGMMWGYRWAKTRNVKLSGLHENEPPDWIVQYGKKNKSAK